MEELIEKSATMKNAREIMRTLPDLERILRRMNPGRVHTVRKNQEKTVFRDSQEMSGNFIETLRKSGED